MEVVYYVELHPLGVDEWWDREFGLSFCFVGDRSHSDEVEAEVEVTGNRH